MARLSCTESGLTPVEYAKLKRLSTPIKIQDFLDVIPMNWEKDGETHRSPQAVLKMKKAHCIEGALLAATALWIAGEAPMVMDLKVKPGSGDFDHVVALYKRGDYWGAISKTNHATLRFRDPIYRTARELALSYFHEWFMNATGEKTLRSYSEPFDLRTLGGDWITAKKDLWEIARRLDKLPHTKIIPEGHGRYLRKADHMERRAGRLVEWPKSDPRT